MGDYEKIICLQTFCDRQAVCNKCPLRNIDGDAGCVGWIKDWDDEKIERAYKIILGGKKVLNEFLIDQFLIDRRVVELRNGERYLVVGNFLIGVSDYFVKGDFTDGLTNRDSRKFDIIRIYKEISRFDTLYNQDLDIIWERKSKKMTKEEIEKALGYEIEIISK